ncbi:MAG: phospho-sugar mutase [Clostridiales bacterium]|nr:phospho-sugar mutase [Clostridiales bacterium]
MDYRSQANLWLKHATDDPEITQQLKSIINDENELKECFYQDLKFGTGGLRGIIYAGTNRMNIYTVRKATQGLANYINARYTSPAVAIAYDSRIKSQLFSKEAARVLSANNIKVYITKELEPTPVLSYLVRNLKCSAGIMITASHNPSKYNGYKAYGSDGCQMTDKSAGEVYNEIIKLDVFNDVKLCDYEEAKNRGMINIVENSVYESYVQNVLSRQVRPGICAGSDLKVVYTPLNGAGNKLVRRVLDTIGVKNVSVVKEQENPDGTFPTCSYPNPEFKQALQLGLEQLEREKADLLLATDPDSDRLGVAVRCDNSYRILTGNELGVMLLDYILKGKKENGTLPKNPIAVKTIVSTPLTQKIADEYGCELIDVLTGFKYIGEQIKLLEEKGEEDRFVFGFEESYGFLSGTYVRDKDAVVASMLVCELAAYYKNKNKTLSEAIDGIYSKYGYCINNTINFEFDGVSGLKTMQRLMDDLRHNTPKKISGYEVLSVSDYLLSQKTDVLSGEKKRINLPQSNVLSFELEKENKVIVRPSGTEPKIKFYMTVTAKSHAEAKEMLNSMASAIRHDIIKKYAQ